MKQNHSIYHYLHHRQSTPHTCILEQPYPLFYKTKKWNHLSLDAKQFSKNGRKGGVSCMDIDSTFESYLLAGCSDSSCTIYDLEQEGEVIASIPRNKPHTGAITDAQWYTSDSGMFSTSSVDGQLCLWDANTLQVAYTFNMQAPVHSFAMPLESIHALMAVAMDANRVRLCDMKSGASTHSLSGHVGSVISVCWSPRNTYLLASGGTDGCIKYWDVRKANACLKTLVSKEGESTSHSGSVKGLQFSSDGLHLISLGGDKKVSFWEGFHGTLVSSQPWTYSGLYRHVRPVLLSVTESLKPSVYIPDNKNIQEFKLYNRQPGRVYKAHFGGVSCLALRVRQGELYSGGSDKEVLKWAC